MKQYEYNEELIATENFIWSLNQRGLDRWQVVNISDYNCTINGWKALNVVFMREKGEDNAG